MRLLTYRSHSNSPLCHPSPYIQKGSAVYTFFESDVMIRSSYFALNNVVYDDNYALVVQAGDSLQLRLEEGITDAGENSVVTSGQCEGFYVQSRKACRVFGKTKQKNHQNLDDSHG